jgi:ribosomal protein S27AE
MQRRVEACSNCGKRTALATGLIRLTGRLGEAVAVVADAAAPGERECSCNACGHTFWTAT